MIRVGVIGGAALTVALLASSAGAQAISAKDADALRLEIAEGKAAVAKLETELATAKITIADRNQRITIYETALAAGLNASGAVEGQRIEKLWADVEARYRALKKPDPGEVFDRESLTFKKPDKQEKDK